MPRQKKYEKFTESGYEPLPVNTSPAFTPIERENQIIAKAYSLVERRIDEGTASPSETTFFLKLGSSRERLEQELKETQNELLAAKADAIRAAQDMKVMYEEAIKAFTDYKGGTSYNCQDPDVPF